MTDEAVANDDLPGMWHRSDFEYGATDAAEDAAQRSFDWHTTCVCGHEANDHDAGECWVTYRGVQCGCSWFTAKQAVGAPSQEHAANDGAA